MWRRVGSYNIPDSTEEQDVTILWVDGNSKYFTIFLKSVARSIKMSCTEPNFSL